MNEYVEPLSLSPRRFYYFVDDDGRHSVSRRKVTNCPTSVGSVLPQKSVLLYSFSIISVFRDAKLNCYASCDESTPSEKITIINHIRCLLNAGSSVSVGGMTHEKNVEEEIVAADRTALVCSSTIEEDDGNARCYLVRKSLNHVSSNCRTLMLHVQRWNADCGD
ncbi:hypothetical protein TNCV_2943411 [Trichonephila clavipes]|nr:hypothetical protein TNCV_2943411 [Trichonephila clavipes]